MKNSFKYFLIFLLLACNKPINVPNTFNSKVVGIKDGDTIEVLYEGKSETIRLLDIDCPEKKQAYGKTAKLFTSDFCYNKQVKVVSKGKRDRYKRILATIFIAGINLNEELVKAGLAWHYKKYSNSQIYSELELLARANKIGLWVEPSPTPPWDFRSKRK